MSWQIRIPHRDRDDSLIDVADYAPNFSDPEEAATIHHLALAAFFEDGLATAGDLIDRIDAADPDQRRRLLDKARAAAGLQTASSIETEELGRANRAAARARQRRIDEAPPELQPRFEITASGAFAVIDPVQVEKDRRREERLAAEAEDRRRERQREATERTTARQARLEERERREMEWARQP